MRKKVIKTKKAPQAIGPYSQAVEAGGTLFISGQIPLDPSSGKVVDGGIREQTEQVLKNIEFILSAAGYRKRDVVKSTCLLTNMDDFQEMNEIYGAFYKEDPPTRAAYEVSRLPAGVKIEIETIAVKG
jgi:2-iminobutanoate/2-iminopropanoate deaminase